MNQRRPTHHSTRPARKAAQAGEFRRSVQIRWGERMFEELEKINERPEPFQFYTASDLWTDEHTSKQMLSFHLNEAIDVSSRNAEFINRSAEWTPR